MYSESDTIEIGQTEGNSFKEIAMSSFRKAGDALSVEMRGGFYSKAVTDKGVKEIYIVDSRDVACNTVRVLADFLLPKFDKDMKPDYKKFEESLKTVKEKFIKASSPKETVVLGDVFYKDIKDKILLETYKNQRLEIHRTLFRAISKLLGRRNYLEIGGKVFE